MLHVKRLFIKTLYGVVSITFFVFICLNLKTNVRTSIEYHIQQVDNVTFTLNDRYYRYAVLFSYKRNETKLLEFINEECIITKQYSTIDVNLPEYQYIANHLEPQECRRLVAALHFHSYDLPPTVDEAENLLDKQVPCIRLLLHWNNSPGEGRGETHEVLGHRLRQLGREDLADWLGRTVFHELGKDIERSLDNPFKDFLTEKPNKTYYGPHYVGEVASTNNATEWLPFDTICYTAVVILLIIILGLLVKIVSVALCKKRKTRRKKKYSRIEEGEGEYTDTTSESEDRFDVQHKI